MAEGKKSFVLYADIIHVVKKLPKDKRGELLTVILEYVNDLSPKVDDAMVDLVFEPIRRQLKRDLEKYEKKREQWSEAGKRSAEVRKAKKAQRSLTDVQGRSTDLTVNVNDNVNVINIKGRKDNFKKIVYNHSIYDNKLLKDFFDYWSEHGAKDRKMRFEKEKSFDVKKRLERWVRNQKQWNANKPIKERL